MKESRFSSMAIPLPPLADQQRIVARIEELSAKIEEGRALRQRSAAEIGALFISAYRVAFEGRGSTAWEHVLLEDACEAIIDYRGRTPPLADSGVPHITSANVSNGVIDWNTTKFVTPDTYEKYMTRGIPQPGDVIFTMEAPLGAAAVIPDGRRFSLAQRTLVLRAARGRLSGEFLAKCLMSPQVREAIYAESTGTTVKGIASKRLRKIGLSLPPMSEQRRIVAYLDDLQAKVDALKRLQAETAAELDAMVPSILEKAFKGEL